MGVICNNSNEVNDIVAHKLWEQAACLFAEKKPTNYGWKYAVKPFLSEIFQSADVGRVLDAGCGIGDLIDVANISPDNYIGIDWSESLIHISKKSNPGYEFVNKSIYFLDEIYCNEFDSVFAINVLQDCEFLSHSSKAIFNSLKPGGRAFVVIENPYWTAYNLNSSQDSDKLPVNSFEVFFSTFISENHPIVGWHRPLNYYRLIFKETGFQQVWSGIEIELHNSIGEDQVAAAKFQKSGAFNTDIFVYFELLKPEDAVHKDRARFYL